MTKASLKRNVLCMVGVVATTAAFLFACGDDDDTTPTNVTPTPEAGTSTDTGTGTDAATAAVSISVNVTYNGAQKGPLLASAWPNPQPGVGTPGGNGSNETPTWPGSNTVQLKNVKPGSYYIFSYVMVGAEHRTGPIATDPTGAPVQVTVEEGKTATATITLFDPLPDGGAEAGDGGDGGDGG